MVGQELLEYLKQLSYRANAFGSTFTFLANTQNPTKMQKSYQAYAQAILCGATQTHIVDDHEEGRTYNRGGKIRVGGSYLRLL